MNPELAMFESIKPPLSMDLATPEEATRDKTIKWHLLNGNIGQESLIKGVRAGNYSPDEVFQAGVDLLSNGNQLADKTELSIKEAATVLDNLNPHGWTNNGSHGRFLSMISRQGNPSHRDTYRHDPDKSLLDARVEEMETRIVNLLSQGYLDLYANPDLRDMKRELPSGYNKSVGLGIVQSLATIPEFRHDVRAWLEEVAKTPTTDGATLPHFFSYFLKRFSLYKPSDYKIALMLNDNEAINKPYFNSVTRSTYLGISRIYQNGNHRQDIKDIINLCKVNTGTGDTYVSLDNNTLPKIANLFGSQPTWLELAVSRGVVWNGTYRRAIRQDIHPQFMMADLYHPGELWRATSYFHKAADPNDPDKLHTFVESDPELVRRDVWDVLKSQNNKGFIRSNFESATFVPQVLSRWRKRNIGANPDVVRMTGVLPMTRRGYENLLNTVNPNGGVIILSEGNTLDVATSTMWQVNKNRHGVNLSLLYSSK